MSQAFTQYIKILGRGKKGARPLTEQEAEQAMQLMLAGEVAPEQVGAFWMLIRIREETVDETVGFTRAVRTFLNSLSGIEQRVHLDWPAYAGKRNELPWFLLSAFALAKQGIKIVMHGHSFQGEERLYVDQILPELGITLCTNREQVEQALSQDNFAYISLAGIAPELGQMMDLKYTLGLRSPVNTVVRMMNPFGAEHSVHGVFHKGYDELHLAASERLEDKSVLVFRGGNGEAEVNPERDVTLGKWQQPATSQKGESTWQVWPKAEANHLRQKDDLSITRLQDHWSGKNTDPFGAQAVRQTLAAIIGLIEHIQDQTHCLQRADQIWERRLG